MTGSCFSALLVEDNPGDAFYVNRLLVGLPEPAARFGSFKVDAVGRLSAAVDALSRGSYDVVLLDLVLPDSRGIATLLGVQEAAPGVPIVVLTGWSDVDLAVRAMAHGAQDFLSKDHLHGELIARTLRYAIERRRAQEQLVSALEEKEVLLHELHHRAKNNLQLISSLLSLQARRDRDPHFVELVSSAQRRIDAIALAHDQLHRAQNLSRIDFSAYLATLARAVHVSHGGEGRGVSLELSLSPCELPLQEALPTGLIVNELLTNALKHAFPDGRRGTIRVEARLEEKEFVLELADDGVGFSPGVRPDTCALGIQIVTTLSEQLAATLDRTANGGTHYRLSFACGQAT